jgi:nucleotide-binding universal stress UspA family protein
MYDTILVPTDGSESANVAGRHATGIAAAVDADVHALSVIDPKECASAVGDVSELNERQRQAYEQRATEAAAAVTASAGPGVAVEEHVLCGTPSQAIEEFVTRNDADLVAMGTHGRTGLKRQLVGSVAERTIRTVPVPVLTAHHESPADGGYDTILVPTDGSEYATAAVDHALSLARAVDAGLQFLYAGTDSHGEDAVATAAERVADRAPGPVETATVDGTPPGAINDYAARTDADLIVMGTHGRTGLRRQLVGSVTERTIRTAELPVLAVHLDDG